MSIAVLMPNILSHSLCQYVYSKLKWRSVRHHFHASEYISPLRCSKRSMVTLREVAQATATQQIDATAKTVIQVI